MAAVEIRNVSVFDGNEMTGIEKVVIENGMVSAKDAGETIVDGGGGTLLPGFIDSHVHLLERDNLEEMCRYGVTTAMDMANSSPDVIGRLRNVPGLTDIRSCCHPAFAAGSVLALKMGFPVTAYVKNIEDSERFVKEQIASGADYIKIIMEDKGINEGVAFPQEILVSLIKHARQAGKKTIAHVASPKTYKAATEAGVDVLTHIPFAGKIPRDLANEIAARNIVSVPTIYMMKGIVETIKKKVPFLPISYKNIQRNMGILHKHGITFLAGTDSNVGFPATPFSAAFGTSFLEELVLMVDCGLTPIEALRSATSVPASFWGMDDRGVIKAGSRADLVLVDGNPLRDIRHIKNIKQVWVCGAKAP